MPFKVEFLPSICRDHTPTQPYSLGFQNFLHMKPLEVEGSIYKLMLLLCINYTNITSHLMSFDRNLRPVEASTIHLQVLQDFILRPVVTYPTIVITQRFLFNKCHHQVVSHITIIVERHFIGRRIQTKQVLLRSNPENASIKRKFSCLQGQNSMA